LIEKEKKLFDRNSGGILNPMVGSAPARRHGDGGMHGGGAGHDAEPGDDAPEEGTCSS